MPTIEQHRGRRAIGIHQPRSASTKDTYLPYTFVTFATLLIPPLVHRAITREDSRFARENSNPILKSESSRHVKKHFTKRKQARRKVRANIECKKRKKIKYDPPTINFECMLRRYLIRFHALSGHNVYVKYTKCEIYLNRTALYKSNETVGVNLLLTVTVINRSSRRTREG
jgi:hypothetical protein